MPNMLPRPALILSWVNNHKRISLILIVSVLALFFLFRPKAKAEIETVTISKDTLSQTISASGSIDSQKSATLSFLTSGKLVYLGVKKGDMVQAGQTIATLDTRSIQKNLENSLRDYAIQRNTFEDTLQKYGASGIQDAQNDSIKRILENNQYDLDKAVASTELQSLAEEQSVLTTPISGIVTKADATATGVNVTPTTTFVVADPQALVFKVDVDESDIGKVTLNQVMKINLDAYPDQTLTLPITKIDFASHTTSTGSTVYTVEAELGNNDNYQYRIGMNGDAEIILAEKRNVLVVPQSSLVDENYVYVKDAKNTFIKKKIVVGLKNDTDAEVISGLSEGDEVALQGSDMIPATKK